MAIEDDVQALLNWRDAVIASVKETQEFSDIDELTASTLLRLAKDGTSYKISAKDFKRQVFVDSNIPQNPDSSDDGIYYVKEGDNLGLYLLDGGDVYTIG